MLNRQERAQAYCSCCGREFAPDRYVKRCPDCQGLIFFKYPLLENASFHQTPNSIWKYREVMPLPEDEEPVSIGEGQTPLVRSRISGSQLFLKNEMANPSGSVKDRAMSVGVSMAKHFGFHNLINASTGSAGLATSAYSARAGMRAAILVPAGVPIERVAPMQAYGAFVLGLVGTIQNALDFVEEICAKLPVFETTTHRPSNPYQNEGTKTIAFELFEQLGGAPDWVILPRASGGTLAAIWRGFDELRQMGLVDHGPHCVASELSRLNTFERAIKEGAQLDAEIRQISGQMDENIVTVGVKLAHAYPVDGEEALSAIRSSGGTAVSVTDEEIMAALLLVAQKDGLFCEPSSATSVAAYQKLIEQGVLKPSDTVVCLLTGSGYREMPVICQAIQPRFPQVNITQALDRLTEFYHVS